MSLKPLKRSDLPQYEAIFESTENAMGFLPNSMLIMARDPRLLLSFGMLSQRVMLAKRSGSLMNVFKLLIALIKESFKKKSYIDRGLRYLIALAVSSSAGCRYCQAHTSHSAKNNGVSEEKIKALFSYEDSTLYSDAERAALTLAFSAGEMPNATTPEQFDELGKYFNEAQILDIVAVISYFGFLNRWNDTLGTALEAMPIEAAQTLLSDKWQQGKH